MQTIDVQEAGANLDELIEAAARGESFIIAKGGKALATVTGIPETAKKPRILGALAGKFTVPDDFDRMFEDEIREMFEGNGQL